MCRDITNSKTNNPVLIAFHLLIDNVSLNLHPLHWPLNKAYEKFFMLKKCMDAGFL